MQHLTNKYVAIDSVGIGSETAVWSPASGKRFRLLGYQLTSSVAGNIVLRDGVGGSVIVVVPSVAGGAPGPVLLPGTGILSGALNRALTADGPALSQLSGMIWGVEE